MDNPWKNIEKKNNRYIASQDITAVETCQRNMRDAFYLRLGCVPSPYTGSPAKAAVYLLTLNPGYADNDETAYAPYQDLLLKDLTHENKTYPFVVLNPQLEKTPGGIYWRKHLRELIEHTSLETVAHYVFNAEYFPYHSKHFANIQANVPTQNYTFYLVRKAITDGKLIVIMRARKQWYKAVKELQTYKNVLTLKNPQSAYISKANMQDGDFEKIVQTLTKAAKA